ncbi:MAG: hypothetical protein ACT6FE_07745 [Methanosarcinaceae archaeon]
MGVVCENTILDLIKDELRELKDELLIYNDPAFMKSIKTGIKEAEGGAVVKCEDVEEVKNLFESL